MNLKLELSALRNTTPALPVNERAKLGCKLAKQFEKVGEYQRAYDCMSEFWPDRTQWPTVDELDEPTKAEVLLRAGNLAAWLGVANQIEGSLEIAKDLITESIDIFKNLGRPNKIAESEGDLGLCYWREGSYDEARITLRDALNQLEEEDADLKAVLLIRAGIVEVDSGQFSQAFRFYNEVALLLEASEDDALKGSFHLSFAILFRRLARTDNNSDHIDHALIEYAAASFHFEQVGNRSQSARVENNLGFLYFKIGRYKDAHQHLDRARNLFLELNDIGTVAQVDETRARTLLAEGQLRDAQRIIKASVKTLEKGGQQAILAEALTTYATIMARLGEHSRARTLLQRAIEVAETCGDLEGAGRARLSMIEELSGQTQPVELASIFHAAADLLQKSQDPTANRRLVSGGLKTIDALLAEIQQQVVIPTEGSWEGFSIKREIKKIESRFIERALRDAGGSVSKASRMLGFKHHQSLISLLGARHNDLQDRRSIKRRRHRPLLSKTKREKKKISAPDQNVEKLSILHVEHHRTIARWVDNLLTGEGFHVDTCTNGAAAWEILKGDSSYDALIVDDNLPGLGGLELVLRARAIAHRRNLAIVMLSADDVEKEAWRAGVDAFLKKPEAINQLSKTIVRALEERRKK